MATASALAVLASPALGQEKIFVNQSAASSGTGLQDWSNAKQTIQEAFDIVDNNTATVILVAEGIYRPYLPVGGTAADRSFKFDADWQDIRVVGGFLGIPGGSDDPDQPDGSPIGTILDGAATASEPNSLHVVTFERSPGSLDTNRQSLERCVVQNGRADDINVPNGTRGGGVLITSDARVSLRRLVVSNNWAVEPTGLPGSGISRGGGVYIFQGPGNPPTDLTGTVISNCRIVGNHASFGAGLYYEQGTFLKVGGTTFGRNGRIYPSGQGGPQPQCLSGGAVYLAAFTQSDWSNCLVSDNVARISGGGFYWDPGAAPAGTTLAHGMTQCTVTLNAVLGDPSPAGGFTATTNRGAGLHVDPVNQGPFGSMTFEISNSILYGNRVGRDISVNGTAAAPGARVHCNFSDIGFGESPGVPSGAIPPAGVDIKATCIALDPLFVNVAARNLRLQSTSPCIDAGSSSLIGLDIADVDDDMDFGESLPIDLDGTGRISSSGSMTVDIGAYEF